MNDAFLFLTRSRPSLLRPLAWVIGALSIAALGYLRTATDAQYIFASASILPVAAVSWIGGQKDGWALSLLAAIMWASADILAQGLFSTGWTPFVNGLTHFVTNAFIAYLTARVRTLLEQEQEIASHDALTGLLNRRAFFELGEAEVKRSRRYGHPLAIAFLDLDNFKRLNDTRGHQAGDQALKAVAASLQGSQRTTDSLARLGGDEFAVLLPETGYDAAADAGNKIAAATDAALQAFSPVSTSVGIAWFESAKGDFPAMLDAADNLMYEIKQEGKHGVKVRRFELSASGRAPKEPL